MKHKPRMSSLTLLGLICLGLVALRPAFPQAGTAVVTGTVIDSTGAVIPGASVTLTDIERGINTIQMSNNAGIYEFRFLSPGRYALAAETQGFKRAIKSGLILEVGQTMRVDMELEVGAPSETVQVEAGAAQMLKPETSEVGQVIDFRQVADLPLKGRDFTDLITLNAGVTTGMQSASNTGFNFNGGRTDMNMFMIEGIDNVDMNSNLIMKPSIDAIEEFQIQTGNFSAEYGRSAGGVVQVQLRSGKNEFFGTAFEFLRNDVLDANGFFQNQVPPAAGEDKAPKEKLRRNQFGFSFGGPLKKNKLFFFGDYQGDILRIGRSHILSVPTALERQGDFSQTLAPGTPLFKNALLGQLYPECDPADFVTCQKLPANSLDAPALKVAQLYPLPNIPGTFVPGIGTFNNYIASGSSKNDSHAFNVKIDLPARAQDSLSFRYSFQDGRSKTPAAFGDGTVGPCINCGVVLDLLAGDPRGRSQNAGASWVHTLGPKSVNEFRAGFNRSSSFFGTADGGKNLATEFGIPNVNVSDQTTGLPWFFFSPMPSWTGTSPFTPAVGGYTVYQFTDNFSYIPGKHRLKMGVDLRRRLNNGAGNFFGKGAYIFVPFFTGHAFADFLTGRATQIQQDLTPGTTGVRGIDYGFYFQDDYKVSRTFTLNMGIRYELFPGYVEVADRISNLDPAAGVARLAGKEGQPRQFTPLDKNNWAPRFGFAWSTRGDKTVIRGGYGLSYFNSSNFISYSGLNAPYTQAFSLLNLDFTTFDAAYRLSDGLPIHLRPTPENFDPNNPAGSWRQNNVNQRIPYSQYFSLGVQNSLGWNMVVEAAYVGTRGVKLPGEMEGNPAPPGPTTTTDQRRLYHSTVPNVTGINLYSNEFNSIYHAMQLKAQKRFSSGLQFLATYTYGRSIDDRSGSAVTGGGDSNPDSRPQDSMNRAADRARSSFDITHRFVLAYNYEIPLGRGHVVGRNWNSVLEGLLGGWQINGILTMATGMPFSVFATSDASCGCTANDMRADRIADGNLPEDKRSITGWFDKTAFKDPPSSTPTEGGGRVGNAGRSIIYGPDLTLMDFSLFKKFKLSERLQMQFRAEFFNIFNNTNFLYPKPENATWQSGGLITQARDPRIGQLAIKLIF